MLINKSPFVFVALLAVLAFSSPVSAQNITGGDGPLAVTDVIVDKSDKDAVMARDQAILEAQRSGLKKLAERSLSPEAFKIYRLPDDAQLSTMVQDFEIKSEQISPNRYVARFTVRFNETAMDQIKIFGDMVASSAPTAVSAAGGATPAPAPVVIAGPEGKKSVLILPYFETMSGKKILWDENNPWRAAWTTGNSKPYPGLTLIVPPGDTADVMAGNPDAVWANDFTVLERLRAVYRTDEIALTVANKSGIRVTIDLYIYKDGKLSRKKPIHPYVSGANERDLLGQSVAQVIAALPAPEEFVPEKPVVEDVSASEEAVPEPEKLATPVLPKKEEAAPALPQKFSVDATMSFRDFPQWLEVQKRLTAISPGILVDISSLHKDSAKFTISAEMIDGVEGLKKALQEKGMLLTETPVTPSGITSETEKEAPPPKPVYDLKFTN